MYKVKTGRKCVDVKEKKLQESKKRGELVQVCLRVKPLTFEVLKDMSERRCCSMGQIVDESIMTGDGLIWC